MLCFSHVLFCLFLFKELASFKKLHFVISVFMCVLECIDAHMLVGTCGCGNQKRVSNFPSPKLQVILRTGHGAGG